MNFFILHLLSFKLKTLGLNLFSISIIKQKPLVELFYYYNTKIQILCPFWIKTPILAIVLFPFFAVKRQKRLIALHFQARSIMHIGKRQC
ncbi:TPA: hypothetical protein DD799_05045 [Candidatus Dependentiae bacterium]|nr:hypothetical protein [Candidatus Dependentiae bacterium]